MQAGQKKWTQARSREVRRRKKSFPCSTVWSQRIWGYSKGAFSAEQVPGLPARDWQIILQLDRTAAMFPLSLVPRPMYRTSDGSQKVKSGIQASCPNSQQIGNPKGISTSVPAWARYLDQEWWGAGLIQLVHWRSSAAGNTGGGWGREGSHPCWASPQDASG